MTLAERLATRYLAPLVTRYLERLPPAVRELKAARARAMQSHLTLRAELARRMLWPAFAILAVQATLLWIAGMPAERFAFVSGFPLAWLLMAIPMRPFPTRKTGHPFLAVHPFFLMALFCGITLTGILPIVYSPYPQFGGVMVVTIVLCGLLVGEFFIGAWTLIACVMHIGLADVTDWGWQVHVGWCVVYVATAWIVTVFTRHLERLLVAQSDAEAQQRDAIVAERTRFARDIHDTLAQGFTGILMQLNAAEQRLPAGAESLTHVATARDLARDSLEEARRSVGALRAGALTRGTLLGAIEQIAHTLTTNSATQVVARLEGQPYPLTEQHESTLLRIAQEALTNAVRHAGAVRITVRLSYQTGSVVLALHDDGRGLTGREPSGFGIDGMRQRASEIGADIQIVSHPGEGTGIVVTLPHG